ncbi:hypothetical protein [Neorhodopirellula pilleata]|uniref:Uncharacterized protein n=1 Tax=Neorhodopirellula pilleata TaxID=2714738 RepID=A0A5C6AWK1_9BACT|nr:hypothetical protein [Neorhodopirellula pilleata]TWU04008.1 hypothetical protein Pla100_09440 [Neorhodopirellula pilleata]
MKTNPSEQPPQRESSVLWIGATDHPETLSVWKWCQDHVDMIAVRSSIQDAVHSPPRSAVDRVLILSTNRFDVATMPTAGNRITELRRQHSGASFLLIRGPLVAPTVALPPTDSFLSSEWIESISSDEALVYLESCRRRREQSFRTNHPPVFPVVIIASHYSIAEAYMDSICMFDTPQPRWTTWQRKLSPQTSRGEATILWDDSVATPATGDQWRRRLGASGHLRHLWATGIATSAQRRVAKENGIDEIIEKPGRLECLIEALESPR